MYANGSIKGYLNELAARKPAPGGGSASALAASIGVALMEMVVNYTVGNEKYNKVEDRFRAILKMLQYSRAKLEIFIDEDAVVYDKLRAGMKTYKEGSPEMEHLYKESAAVPYGICKIAFECLKLCEELERGGNRNLITDTAIAAIMLEGAFLSAKYNVYINLKYIKDLGYIEKVHNFLYPLEEEVPRLKEEILHRCEEVISK